MFLIILILVLLIQVCNLYYYHTTKKNLIGLAGIIAVSCLTFYDIYTKRHKDKDKFKSITFIQILIIIISTIFIIYYCKNTPNKHILQRLI